LRPRNDGSIALLLTLPLLCGSACESTDGLRATPPGKGPRILHDLEARPFPEIPLPNDLGTRPDPTSPTGLRLNVSMTGETRLERDVRRRLDRLDGWGTYQPIAVRFDAPLDLGNIIERHQGNLDFADDAAYLVNIDPGSPDYGEPVLLDIGRGNFPATLPENTAYHPSDPRQDSLALLFESVDEDVNGNGVLDPGEDTDADGVLDRPNVWPPGASPADGLLTFYELESNTLLLRPVVPLREQSQYAVILTDRLIGRHGEPVRSPFPQVHHRQQEPPLSRLRYIFERWKRQGIPMAMDDVAFAWVFTTQTVTGELKAIRDGLHGYGPLSWLAEQFPPDTTPLPAMSDDRPQPRYALEIKILKSLATLVLAPAFDITSDQAEAMAEDMNHIDYVVQGRFVSPDFLTDEHEDFIWDWAFDIDAGAGRARVQPGTVHYTMTIPRKTEHHEPPFPVAIYAHGFGLARVESLGFAGIMARYGIASIGIDAWSHGIWIPPEDVTAIMDLTELMGFLPFAETFLEGRARDVVGDGRTHAGADTFSSYAFHTRDTVRQTVIDHLQLIRVLRQFDGEHVWEHDVNGDGRPDLAGDFDGDGTVDAGGPNREYYQWGSSMGGIHSAIIGAMEPAIVATAPVAGGAGMTNLTIRSRQETVRNDTVVRVLGPLVYGEPVPDRPGTIRIAYHASLSRIPRDMTIAEVSGVQAGCRVRLDNLDLGREQEVTLREDLRFTLHLKADWDDRFSVTVIGRDGQTLAQLSTWQQDVNYWLTAEPTYRAGEPLRSPAEGWGLHRGSPDYRRLIGLAQAILEPGDPINYVPHYFLEPLDLQPEGPTSGNLLVVATVGDPMDPVDLHGAKARAAGIMEYLGDDPDYGMPVNDWLIERWVYEGVCGLDRYPPNADGVEVLFDPDSLDHLGAAGGNGFYAPDPESLGLPPLRLTRETPAGVSGLRFGHIQPCGKHSFFITDPTNRFNIDEYLASMIGYWFAAGGRQILDDGCHEDSSCPLP